MCLWRDRTVPAKDDRLLAMSSARGATSRTTRGTFALQAAHQGEVVQRKNRTSRCPAPGLRSDRSLRQRNQTVYESGAGSVGFPMVGFGVGPDPERKLNRRTDPLRRVVPTVAVLLLAIGCGKPKSDVVKGVGALEYGSGVELRVRPREIKQVVGFPISFEMSLANAGEHPIRTITLTDDLLNDG